MARLQSTSAVGGDAAQGCDGDRGQAPAGPASDEGPRLQPCLPPLGGVPLAIVTHVWCCPGSCRPPLGEGVRAGSGRVSRGPPSKLPQALVPWLAGWLP